MNKKFITIFVTLALCAYCTHSGLIGDVMDEAIYKAIGAVLKVKYSDDPEMADCLLAEFKSNKIADEFYTVDLLTNQEKLSQTLQPYIDKAQVKCTVKKFIQTPLGIGVLVIAFLIILGCIICVARCICC